MQIMAPETGTMICALFFFGCVAGLTSACATSPLCLARVPLQLLGFQDDIGVGHFPIVAPDLFSRPQLAVRNQVSWDDDHMRVESWYHSQFNFSSTVLIEAQAAENHARLTNCVCFLGSWVDTIVVTPPLFTRYMLYWKWIWISSFGTSFIWRYFQPEVVQFQCGDCSDELVDISLSINPSVEFYIGHHGKFWFGYGVDILGHRSKYIESSSCNAVKLAIVMDLSVRFPPANVKYQSAEIPGVISRISQGLIPNSKALHIAELVLMYSYVLWRCRNNADRIVHLALLYKYLAVDQSLPFASISPNTWDQISKDLLAWIAGGEFDFTGSCEPNGDVQFQSLEFSDVGKFLATSYDGAKGLAQSKLANVLLVLTAFVGYCAAGVPISNLPSVMLQLNQQIRAGFLRESFDCVDLITSSVAWLSTTGYDLVTGKLSIRQLAPSIPLDEWQKRASHLVDNWTVIEAETKKGNFDKEISGKPIGTLNEQLKELYDLVSDGEAYIRKLDFHRTSAAKKVISPILVHLRQLQVKVSSEIRSQSVRMAPFSVLLFGETGIGKSTLISYIARWHSACMQKPFGSEYMYTLNPSAKYWDGFRTYKDVLILDDIGSTKMRAGADTLIEAVIRTNNNVPFNPDQAALEDKGAHPFIGSLVIGTTNRKGFNASDRVNNPEALHRRFPFVITASLKSQFSDGGQLNTRGMLLSETISAWNFKIEQVQVGRDVSGPTTNYRTVADFSGSDSMLRLRDWFTEAELSHKERQDMFMTTKNTPLVDKFCHVCRKWKCQCVSDNVAFEDAIEVQSVTSRNSSIGDEIAPAAFQSLESVAYFTGYLGVFSCLGILVYHCGLLFLSLKEKLLLILDRLDGCSVFLLDWVTWFPTVQYTQRVINRTCSRRNLYILLGVTGAIVAFVRMYRDVNSKYHADDLPGPGGSPPPPNCWIQRDASVTCLSETSRSLCGPNGQAKLDKLQESIVNIVAIGVDKRGTSRRIQGVALMSGHHILTCYHTFKDLIGPVTVSLTFPRVRNRAISSQVNFEGLSSDRVIRHFPDRDLSIIYTSVTRSNITNLLVTDQYTHSATPDRVFLVTVNRTPEMGVSVHQMVSSRIGSGSSFSGLVNILIDNPSLANRKFVEYRSPIPMISGMSGSMVIGVYATGLAILGIHTAGSDCMGYGIVLDRDDVSCAPTGFLQEPCVASVAQAEFQGKDYGDVHLVPMDKRCPLFPIEGVQDIPRCNFLYYGRDADAAYSLHKSKVAVTPFSSLFQPLAETTLVGYGADAHKNCVCKKEAPKMGWESKRAYLSVVSTIKNSWQHFDTLLAIRRSFVNYVVTRLPDSERALLRSMKPLSVDEAINGVDGIQYLDHMNFSTSAGRPYNVRKAEVLVKDTQEKIHLPSDSKFEYFHTMVRSGIRSYLPFKASLKDEPVTPSRMITVQGFRDPLPKGTRLFMAANMDLTILIRMYFMQYVRLAQRNHFLFFSAPGMNCNSVIWERLFRFLTHFGLDRILAGDYSFYDQAMQQLFSVMSFYMITDLFRFSRGYTEQDLLACHTLVCDITSPMCDIDGDLFEILGTNPSGHPLTVHNNCLANILYIGFAWMEAGHPIDKFWDNVHLMTYGDDNIMGVSIDYKFTYQDIALCLEQLGVVYTRSDKSSIGDISMDNIYSVDFLKRRFSPVVFDGKERMLAPLDRRSIFKTLHLWLTGASTLDHTVESLSSVWQATLLDEGVAHIRDVIRTHIESLGRTLEAGFPTPEQFFLAFDNNSLAYVAFAGSEWSCAIGDDTTMFIAYGAFFRFVLICWISPIYEEGVKRVHPLCKHLLIWGEFITFLYADFSLWNIGARLVCCWLHYMWAQLPIMQGIFWHATWNFIFGGGFMLLILGTTYSDCTSPAHVMCASGNQSLPYCEGLGINAPVCH